MYRCIRLSASICVSWSTRKCTSSLVFRLDWRVHQKSGVDGVDRHTGCLSSCTDASGCPQVSAFHGQQESVPVHLSSVWTGEFTKLLRPVVSLLRQLGVKLHVYLDDWLIRADTPESGTSSTACPDNHQSAPVSWLDHQLREVRPHSKSRLPIHRDAVQHSTFHSGAPTENAFKGPVSSSALDSQSEHNCQRSAQASRYAGVHGFAGPARTAPSSSSPMVDATAWCQRTGNWSDRIQVPQWVLSEVAWWSSPAVLQGLPLVTKETEVSLFTDASSSGWGAQLGSRSTQGQWSASQQSCHINVLEMQAVIYAVRDFLPQLRSRVVRLMCDNAVTVAYIKNEGGHEIAHFDAEDHSAAQVVQQQGDYVGSRPSARSAQHPGGFPVQSQPDSDHGVDDGHGESTTCVRQVGRATDRLVCDIRQQTTRQVRIAVSGPQGGVDRCHVHALGQGEGPSVCVPAFQDGPASTAEDRSVTRSRGDFDRSTATGSIMVPRANGPIPRRSDSCSSKVKTQDVWTADGVTETHHFRPSNLRAWKLSGPSWELRVISGKLPTWCQGAYENLHNKCMNLIGQDSWRSVGRWHVFRVRSHHFSTYMMHLFRDGLLPLTIISHRTSVASVLRHWVYDPAADPHIKLLVRAFRLERPVQRRIMPKWDLHLVLLSLLRPPFTSQKWQRWGILGWRHSPKMADAEMCVPVSIGFGQDGTRTCTHWV